MGDELDAMSKELFKQGLADVALVAKEFSPQALGQARHRLSIINVARCQVKAQQFATVIDDSILCVVSVVTNKHVGRRLALASGIRYLGY